MWQDAFPCKLKRIYIVGGSAWLLQAIRFIIMLLGKKLRDRLKVLSKVESLHLYIPPEQLPPSLGGTFNLDWDQWVQEALSQEDEGSVQDNVWGGSADACTKQKQSSSPLVK